MHNWIVETKNVKSDGHCGFRAVADQLGFTEESWGRIRGALLHELTTNQELYNNVFIEHGRVEEVLQILDYYKEPAPKEHWFCLPEMGHLVASAFNVALVSLDLQISMTYLPLRTPIPSDPRMICIGFVNNDHYIQVHTISRILSDVIYVIYIHDIDM